MTMKKARLVKAKVTAVSKDKKTLSVDIDQVVPHTMYTKRRHREIKLHVHSNLADVNIGDLVLIQSCRRISSTKTWQAVGLNK